MFVPVHCPLLVQRVRQAPELHVYTPQDVVDWFGHVPVPLQRAWSICVVVFWQLG
jgi:hypothetical protein